MSRKAVGHTDRFPELAAAIAKLRPTSLILDGEIAVFDKNLVSQFTCSTMPTGDYLHPAMSMAFDCL